MRRHIPGVLRLRAESGADVRGRGKGSGGAAGERAGGARGRMRHLLFPAVVAVGTTGAVTAVSVAIAAAGQRAAPTPGVRVGAASPAGASSPDAGSPAAGPHGVGPPPAGSPAAEPHDAEPPDDEVMTPSRPTVVSLGRTRVGSVLVDDAGMTLYVFSADRPGVSRCTGACARSWLPVRSQGGKPRGSALLPAATIGSILRGDGSNQVTLWRQPLYHYVGDRKPGDVNGQGRTGFGGSWQAATLQEKS